MFDVFCEIWATFWIILGTMGLFILSILIFRDIVMFNHKGDKYCENESC